MQPEEFSGGFLRKDESSLRVLTIPVSVDPVLCLCEEYPAGSSDLQLSPEPALSQLEFQRNTFLYFREDDKHIQILSQRNFSPKSS